MKFEWDVLKAATNVDEHGVSFQEAETVFGDSFELTIPDPGHSGSGLGSGPPPVTQANATLDLGDEVSPAAR